MGHGCPISLQTERRHDTPYKERCGTTHPDNVSYQISNQSKIQVVVEIHVLMEYDILDINSIIFSS